MSQCIEGSHEFEMLVEREMVCLYRATCGCLRLQIGDVDMRITQDEYEQLVSAISELNGLTGLLHTPVSDRVQ